MHTLTDVNLQSAEIGISHLPECTHLRNLVIFQVQPSQVRSVQVDNCLHVSDPVLLCHI